MSKAIGNRSRRMPYRMYERMAECFEELGWADRCVAEYLGCERKAVGNYRRGESIPDSYTLMLLCCLFKVSADWMLGLSDEKRKPCRYYSIDV